MPRVGNESFSNRIFRAALVESIIARPKVCGLSYPCATKSLQDAGCTETGFDGCYLLLVGRVGAGGSLGMMPNSRPLVMAAARVFTPSLR